MQKYNRFIIVDDDPLSCKICALLLKKIVGEKEILTFEFPQKALDFIETTYTDEIDLHTILFLDINMPLINGWQFLDKFAEFNDNIKKHFTIYILSSSVDNRDMELAKNNQYVKEYLTKPLSIDFLKAS